MTIGSILGGAFGGAILFFLLIFAFVWFFLPFAVFGIKKLLREDLAIQREIRGALRDLKPAADGPTKACPQCAERVKRPANVCRFCGHEFTSTTATPPPTPLRSP